MDSCFYNLPEPHFLICHLAGWPPGSHCVPGPVTGQFAALGVDNASLCLISWLMPPWVLGSLWSKLHVGPCCKLGCFCLQEIEFQLKVAFRYGACCLTPYHLARSPEEGGFKVASFNGLIKLRLWNFFFKLNLIYLCSCTGSSSPCGLFFSFRARGGYSLVAVCGLLTAVASLVAEHGIKVLSLQYLRHMRRPSP